VYHVLLLFDVQPTNQPTKKGGVPFLRRSWSIFELDPAEAVWLLLVALGLFARFNSGIFLDFQLSRREKLKLCLCARNEGIYGIMEV
jgi:hypothetical protein